MINVDIRSMVVWEAPLVSVPGVATIWTIIIQHRISCSMHRHLRHLVMGKLEQRGGGKGKEQSQVPQKQPSAHCRSWEREKGCSLHSESLKSRGRGSFFAWVVSTYFVWTQRRSAETECRCADAVVWQKNSHRAWMPPRTLPELAVGPRRSCSSECWAIEHTYAALRTGEAEAFPPKWKVHVWAKSRDRGGDTEVRGLRSGSWHYWEEKKPQMHQPAYLSSPLTHYGWA